MEIASGEAQRTILLLQDLLELARADNGQIYFNLEPIVLNNGSSVLNMLKLNLTLSGTGNREQGTEKKNIKNDAIAI